MSSAPTPSAKRPRTAAPRDRNHPTIDELDQADDAEPTSKATRTSGKSARPLLCTLPPTCNPPNRPTHLASSKDLETHYATYHAHVCEERGCGCVFPEARLLELHQTECHDPIAALRRERGEKIFACHLASCPRLFAIPKARRLHLIEAHQFPKQYFFAVTNKGVGGLLKKWGEGASMIRGEWKPREAKATGEDDEDDEDEDGEDNDATPRVETTTPPAVLPHVTRSLADGPLIEEDSDDDPPPQQTNSVAVDNLADAMGTLSLIPSSVRFGRGARGGGHIHRSNRGGHAAMDVEMDGGRHYENARGYAGRGRGGRARGGVHAVDNHHNVHANRGHPPMSPRGLGRGMRGGRVRVAPVGRGRY